MGIDHDRGRVLAAARFEWMPGDACECGALHACARNDTIVYVCERVISLFFFSNEDYICIYVLLASS